ncbi:TPA: GNAT family N-acetyltransferase [Candidatus Poribacteria bacterium]|nr:GNAT family N-acetyltransferase [Candidatus Poribacteria bacterium]
MEQVFDITTGLKIRKASIDDASSLHTYCFPSETLEEVEKKLKRDIERMDRGDAYRLVADINGYAVGNILLEFDKKNKKVAQVSQLVVTGPLRGSLVADKLMEVASDSAKQNNVEILQIEANRSDGKLIEKYKSWGFVEKEIIILEKKL